jgi:hypothetical protein
MFRLPGSLLAVQEFFKTAQSRPQSAQHPGTIAQLNRAVDQFAREQVKFLPFGALHAPAAPRTAGVRTQITGAIRETGTTPWDASRPCFVVGMRPSLSVLATGGATTPQIDDIDVDLTIDERDRLTSSRDASQGLLQTGWVSLGSLGVLTPRLLLLDLNAPAPRLNFNFRWANPTLNTFKDAIVKMDLFVIYHDDLQQ